MNCHVIYLQDQIKTENVYETPPGNRVAWLEAVCLLPPLVVIKLFLPFYFRHYPLGAIISSTFLLKSIHLIPPLLETENSDGLLFNLFFNFRIFSTDLALIVF